MQDELLEEFESTVLEETELEETIGGGPTSGQITIGNGSTNGWSDNAHPRVDDVERD